MPATPPRMFVLPSYYDATATSRESDYGNFLSICAEDFYFNSFTRAIALGRLRREIRNNPYLAGLVNKFPEAVGVSNLRSRTSFRDYNQAKDKFWFRWSKIVTNTGDSLRSVEEIVLRELLIAGEVFFVLLANGKIQVIPSEFCGSPTPSGGLGELANGEVNGITYASNGLPTGYRFGKMTNAGAISFTDAPVVNARFVIHVFQKDRVQMGRGIPWLLPSLRTAHDLYEITRSKTKQIKDANQITGVIYTENPSTFLKGLAGSPLGPDGQPVAETPDSPADTGSAQQDVIELRNGTLITLRPGEKVQNLMTQYNAADYKELIMLMLHAMSAPVGLPVELWFSGLGDVNYSGFKGLGTQWDARRSHITSLLEDRYLNRLYFWRVSKAANEGDLPQNPAGDDDLIQWAWRRTAILDEEKKAKSNQLKLLTGEASLADIWEENGQYADEVFEHRRQLWIQLQTASGALETDGDHADIEVPLEFLLRGLLPGETPLSTKITADPVVDTPDPKQLPGPDDPIAAANNKPQPDAA